MCTYVHKRSVVVGTAGIEPATSWPPARRATPALRPAVSSMAMPTPGELSFFAPGEPKCDVCLERNPAWDYHTNMFILPEDGDLPMYVDDGEWGICDGCHALLQAKDVDGLVDRGFHGLMDEILVRRSLPAGQGVDLVWNRRNQCRILGAFFENFINFESTNH